MNIKRHFASIRSLLVRALNGENTQLQNGRILEILQASIDSKNLTDFEFKIFSQWGDDGIIHKLISTFEIKNKTFVEFGVENFQESNCRYLMTSKNWRGLVIDGSKKNIEMIRNSDFYWKHDLQAQCDFITAENINDLISKANFDEDIGLLSIDVDGVDYWILREISVIRPRVLVVEYNALFGSERSITVPYRSDFIRTKAHHSNLYWGASLKAFIELANDKGYEFIGTNSSGVNAFFIRRDLVESSPFPVLDVNRGFTKSTLRQSRDRHGKLNFLSEIESLKELIGLPVVNTLTGEVESL